MATDDAVARSVDRGECPPTLRVYGWRPPAISLGYAQRLAREIDLDQCAELGVDVVRRPTGGRAVLHWRELTYSVVCSADHPDLGGSVTQAYRKISACLVSGIGRLGVRARVEPRRRPSPSPRGEGVVPPCFTSTTQYEVTVNGRKLVGSAQRRRASVLLQHGSVLLGPEHRRIVDLMPLDSQARKAELASQLESRTTCLDEVLGRETTFDAAADALRRGFEEQLGVGLQESGLTPGEKAEASRLVSCRYGTDAWNLGNGRRPESCSHPAAGQASPTGGPSLGGPPR